MVGKRIGYGKEAMFPSSIALTSLGAALLWFGWFGFNAGSALAADGVAGSAFLATNTSASTGALAWMFTEWAINRKPTVLGIASGAVAGLVAITPAAKEIYNDQAYELLAILTAMAKRYRGLDALQIFMSQDPKIEDLWVQEAGDSIVFHLPSEH